MTRIIAGSAGGRTVRTPPGPGTRPTSDRVREAVFSALDARDAVRGARVLDLYAGSGALGLEAASRGAASVVLVESNRRAADVIAANARTLGLDRARVLRSTVAAASPTIPPPPTSPTSCSSTPRTTSPRRPSPPCRPPHPRLAGAGALLVVERSTRSPEPTWPHGIRLATKPKKHGETTVWYATTT